MAFYDKNTPKLVHFSYQIRETDAYCSDFSLIHLQSYTPLTIAYSMLPGERLSEGISLETGVYEDQKGVNRASLLLSPSLQPRKASLVPSISSLVLARIVKITASQAHTHILSVEHIPLPNFFHGLIRIQDVRRHEIDKLAMEACFNPGDIVKARVISLGDSKSYYLSTAEEDLGVVLARSEDGKRLQPYDWVHMIEPESGILEARKVAKPAVDSQ